MYLSCAGRPRGVCVTRMQEGAWGETRNWTTCFLISKKKIEMYKPICLNVQRYFPETLGPANSTEV
jgi:hypothetical protein